MATTAAYDPPPRRKRDARDLRVYQQWQGNERFFCGGRCMAGPNWRSCIGSVLLLVVPTVVFLVWVAWYMGRRVSWAIFAISFALPVLCLSWFLVTACSDPGVLPRQEPDEEWLAGRKPRTKEVAVNGHAVTVRYNDTTHFYQPPRAHHCSVNDNCIERFDHHCPWVGTTIGLRNYRTFLLFIYGSTVYICWTFAISLWSFWVKAADLKAQRRAAGGDGIEGGIDAPIDILAVIAANPAAVALCVVCFIFFWFVGGLSGFHTYLVATNQTTYENFSAQRRGGAGGGRPPNPYDLGLPRNCASVWCARVPPPRVDYRARVGEARRARAAAASSRSLESAASASAAAAGPAAVGHSDADSDAGSGSSVGGGGAEYGGGGGGGNGSARRGGPVDIPAGGGGKPPAVRGGGGNGGNGSGGPVVAPEHVTLELAAAGNGGAAAAAAADGAPRPLTQPPQQIVERGGYQPYEPLHRQQQQHEYQQQQARAHQQQQQARNSAPGSTSRHNDL